MTIHTGPRRALAVAWLVALPIIVFALGSNGNLGFGLPVGVLLLVLWLGPAVLLFRKRPRSG
jgi:hypothetical protein